MINSGTRLEYYILFAVGFIAAIWFFVGYPSQDPRSAADVVFTKEEIKLRAAEQLSQLGFSISEYSVFDASFVGSEQLIDSLQHSQGRQQAVVSLKKVNQSNVKPFFWEVVFAKKQIAAKRDPAPALGPGSDKRLRVYLDENGAFIALDNSSDYLPQQNVRHDALGSVFYASPDSLQGSVFTSVSDSVVSRLLYFDMQKDQKPYSDYRRKAEQDIRNNFRRGIPYRYSSNDARALADFYLARTGWDASAFEVDTTFIKRIGTINAANVRYITQDGTYGKSLELNVVVAPAGALLQMNSNYIARPNQVAPDTWGIIQTILFLLLALAGLIIFFFRMRSRSIDTQSALVVAIIMGVISPVYFFLAEATSGSPFSGDSTINESIILFLQMGFSGAISSVGFFVLFAVSDSLTRQYWPRKLTSYDYLRQGMILNKPVGIVILRSIALAFILVGIWTLFLALLPQAYFSFNHIFISEQALWPSLFLLLSNTWLSFGIVLAVFLLIGSLAYRRSNNKWVTGFFIILACGVLTPFLNSFGPPVYEFLLGLLLGGVLVAIYLIWDFLTLLIAHFLFLGLMGSAAGWLMPNSPDLIVFVVVLGVIVLLAIAGCVAIYTGKEERLLPDYVPGYVEELAQEQRIKQELQIAREVQQSFLPARMPQIPKLDIAAVCKPAYETGGDYYDFIQLDEHRVAIAIGDVSGKGIEAAFYMTFVKGLLHSLCRETDSPAEVLKKTNRLFYENASKGTFISLVYGIVDLEKNEFTFARAGHNPILHINTANGNVKELQPGGLGIGLTKDQIFDNKIEEIKLSITDEDLFLLYTDGIVEALNEKHQFYGTKNLVRLVKKQKNKPSKEIVSAVSKGVETYIGKAKQHDDMTLMAVCYKDLSQ